MKSPVHYRDTLRTILTKEYWWRFYEAKLSRRGFLNAPGLTSQDVFLVSYPRSGNTWVRVIIAHLLYPQRPLTALRELDMLVPDIHVGIPKWFHFSTPRVIKTHRPYPFRHERQNETLYHRCIYVIRHPFDTIRSFYHYQSYFNKTPPLPQFVEMLLKGAIPPGSWNDHVLSWHVMSQGRDFLFIRYEDLETQFPVVVDQLAQYLQVPKSDPAFMAQRCSLEATRRLEREGSIVDLGYPFIRREGERRALSLTDELKQHIWEHSQMAMTRFGYRPDHD